MGVSVLFAGVLGVAGLVTLFLAPWVGGGLLLAAIAVGAAGIFWAGANAGEIAAGKEREEPETPHMRGPAS